MSFEDTRLLELNKCRKFDKTPFIFFADLESLIKRIVECKSYLKKNHLQQK